MILEKLESLGRIEQLSDFRWEVELLPSLAEIKDENIITLLGEFLITKMDVQKDKVIVTYTIPITEKVPSVEIMNFLTQKNVWAIRTSIYNNEDTIEFIIQSQVNNLKKPDWHINLDKSNNDTLKLEISYEVVETNIFK